MNLELRLVSSMNKVFLDEAPREDLPRQGMTCFGNECFSFQAAWTNHDPEARTMVRLEVRSPLGACVRVRRVYHMPVRFAAFPDSDDNYLRTTPGLYPDLLDEPQGDWIAWHGMWESAWIDVEPEGTVAPGRYSIEVILVDQAGAEFARQGMALEILPGKLPPQTLIHTKWFYCDCLCHYYGVEMFSDAFYAIAERFICAAVKRGINMILTPIHTPSLDTAVGGERLTSQLVDIVLEDGHYRFGFEQLDRWVRMCLDAGVEYFEMEHLFSQWGARHAPKIIATVNGEKKRIFGWETDAAGAEYRAFLREYLTALTAHLRALGIADRCWFHISDEPQLDQLESYRAARDGVAELLKGFPIIDALSDLEFYRTGLVPKPVAASNHIRPFLEAGVPGLWTYYCVGQYKDMSNTFLAMPGARTRVLGTQLYKFHIEGFLQWGYNFYNTQYSHRSIDPHFITDGEAFGPAGDAFQVYPGPNGVPQESIRMMLAAEAMQDLRALQYLEALAGREEAMRVLEEGLEAPIEFDRYPRDSAWLLKLRQRVNAAIMGYLRER